MLNAPLPGWLCAIVVLLIGGCQKPLNYEKTFKMEPGDVQAFPIDAPRREQKLKVEVSTQGVPLQIYVVQSQDEDAARQALLDYKKPANSLAKWDEPAIKLNAPAETTMGIETTIPAQTAFAVLITGAKKSCEVKLRITGR